jgi:hypothetical protein
MKILYLCLDLGIPYGTAGASLARDPHLRRLVELNAPLTAAVRAACPNR